MLHQMLFGVCAPRTRSHGQGPNTRSTCGQSPTHACAPPLQVNLFLGVGLLSMPYAIHKGGWAALVPLCLVTSLFGLSAHLIIAAFDRLPPLVPKTYPELGEGAWRGWLPAQAQHANSFCNGMALHVDAACSRWAVGCLPG